jgi:hypothetical protein
MQGLTPVARALTSGASGKNIRAVARLGLLTLVAMLAAIAAEQGFGAPPLPLSARVIAHGELAGFGPFGPAHVQTFRTPAAFLAAYQQAATPSQVSEWVALLRREGFVAVAVEQLGSKTANRGGLSWAMELGSPADAKSELAKEVRSDESHGPVARFLLWTASLRLLPSVWAPAQTVATTYCFPTDDSSTSSALAGARAVSRRAPR